jgi:hypothetical protein
MLGLADPHAHRCRPARRQGFALDGEIVVRNRHTDTLTFAQHRRLVGRIDLLRIGLLNERHHDGPLRRQLRRHPEHA